ncbi:hypothetical protein MNB_SV-13-1150 [hydrothermal vent metagenome]|uniref:Uncharacterized protein n=1 Tax=hydrothermal vent metagenome TaxID=652676 RepID=A0A1W1CLU1_9ZZZZ
MEIFNIDFFIILIPLLVLGIFIYSFYQSQVSDKQVEYIKNYTFPKKIRTSVQEKYPHLKEKDLDKVLLGLKDFFIFSNQAKLKSLSMPSQVVDLAWHEFILFTHEYEIFCKKAFGKFYHHVPLINSQTMTQKGIRPIWELACRKAYISPKNPTQLPLLFAIDTLLDIKNGFRYSTKNKNTISNPNNKNNTIDDHCTFYIFYEGSSFGNSSSSSSCSGGSCSGGD